eukprot:151480_1
MFKGLINKYDDIYKSNSTQWGYGRPVAGAGWMTNILDFASANYNYNLGSYHVDHPNESIIVSESCSCTQDRNEYITNNTAGHCSAYMNCPWNSVPCPDGCWKPIGQTPYIIGSFDWTGFDYKGEPTPTGWPAVNSHFGVNDIIGFPKDMYWYYRSAWINMTDEIILYIMPNTWNGDTETNPEKVRIYTNCKYVEVFVNNKSISNGKQPVDPLKYYSLSVKYEPGSISANCLDSNNKILKTTMIQTTNKPIAIKLSWAYPYNTTQIIGNGQDVALINVFVIDDKNRIVPNSTNLINFALNDQSIAFILGVGNGDPACHERDKGTKRSVFHGKARVLVQSMLNKGGKVTLTATSDGLTSDKIDINVKQPKDKIITI